MDFELTAAGRNAISSQANRGTNQVTITQMAIGDGRGQLDIDDSGRTTLRNERMRSAVVGSAAVVGAARVGVRAAFVGASGAATWDVSEAGLIARVGAAGVEFLLAYGADVAGADPLATIGAGVSTTIAADLRIVGAAADVAVTVSPSISVAGATSFLGLTDTPAAYSAGRLFRANAAGSALEAVTPAQLYAEMVRNWQLAADHAARRTPSTVATVVGIPRGWQCTGVIGTAEPRQQNWWESAAGVELARVTNPGQARNDGGRLYWVGIGFSFAAPGGNLILKQNGLGVTVASGRTWMRATAA